MEVNRCSHNWRVEGIDPWDRSLRSESGDELDTEEMRWMCPGGFTWDCCGKSGGSRGCVQGPHEAEESDEDEEK